MEIWHNPSCSKSRSALSALHKAGFEPTIRRYLDDSPTAAELGDLLHRLGLEPWQLARAKETKDAGIELAQDAEHRQAWIEAMAANPRIIQRPIVIGDDGSAVICRDPEALERATRVTLE